VIEPQPDLPGTVTVAGCPSFCAGGCTHPGLVFGTRLDTSEQVIPVGVAPNQPVPSGFTCAAVLPIGVELFLEAQVNPGFRFVNWASSSAAGINWQPCPCAGSIDPICEFTVKERLYCGATYARQ
jgi:hypothetical protein